MQNSGALLSAIGQSVELAGVVWLFIAAWRTASRGTETFAKADAVKREYLRRTEAKDTDAGDWYKAELTQLGVSPPTWGDLLNPREPVDLSSSRHLLTQYRGGAMLVALGLGTAVLGAWIQVAA